MGVTLQRSCHFDNSEPAAIPLISAVLPQQPCCFFTREISIGRLGVVAQTPRSDQIVRADSPERQIAFGDSV